MSNVTSGGAFDPDGYEVVVDGGSVGFMELNEALDPLRLEAGVHTVRVEGIAANCAEEGGASHEVTVTGGRLTDLEIALGCVPLPELASIRILFVRAERGERSLVLMDADGGTPTILASGGSFLDPDVSPDGMRIVYLSDPGPQYGDPEVRVFDLAEAYDDRVHAGPAYGPRWSPDGREIAFVDGSGDWGGTLHVMSPDGSGSTRIGGKDAITEVAQPSWSPDGAWIAFTRNEDPWAAGNHLRIWVVGRGGTGARPLDLGAHPVWSRTDDRIAFQSFGAGWPDGIRVVHADGAGSAKVLEASSQSNVQPWDWSASGQFVLFTRQTGPERMDVFLLNLDDHSVVRLTADGAWNTSPRFWW